MTTFIDPIAKILGEWSQGLTIYGILFRVVLSLILGTIIGTERAAKRHSAGLRTFMLVSVATTTAMILDCFLSGDNKFNIISAACIVAIAILSSNTMLYNSKNQIKGITTSVALWACGCIGLALGAGLYTLTICAFVALVIALAYFPRLEVYLKNRSNHFEIHLELKNASYLTDFITTIRKLGLRIDDLENNPAYMGSGLSVYTMMLTICSEELKKYKTHKEIIEALKSIEYVSFVEEQN